MLGGACRSPAGPDSSLRRILVIASFLFPCAAIAISESGPAARPASAASASAARALGGAGCFAGVALMLG
jgi:hypothetical protein